jgi:predicted glycosyltransferase
MENCERIALYSHDALGLGHLRRNLAIAEALAGNERKRATLLVTGAREAGVFPMPPGTDCLALPALTKSGGDYRPRSIGMGLDELVELRTNAITSALTAFDPDVLIVDKRALGICGELRPSLDLLRAGGHTHLVLGLRDVLDAPSEVLREWSASGDADAALEYYDAVWVYGDPSVYDVATECDFAPELRDRVSYSGYLARRSAQNGDRDGSTDALRALQLECCPFTLCLLGGGQDGHLVAESFAHTIFPTGTRGVILTGPFMPRSERHHLHRISEIRNDLHVLEFVQDPSPLIRSATSVVAMGGYNTVCELLAADARALVVPRTTPRREQLIRAHRMAELRLLDMVAPDELRPDVLSEWIARADTGGRSARGSVDLDGLRRLPELLDDLVGESISEPEASYAAA